MAERGFNVAKYKAQVWLPVISVREHPARQFGWFWEITDDVDFITRDLARKGVLVNVWQTQQFKAIERLTTGYLNFPASFDHALHGAFCRILVIETLCRSAVLQADIIEAIAQVKEAAELHFKACDSLSKIHHDVLRWADGIPDGPGAPKPYEFNQYNEIITSKLGKLLGVLEAELKFRKSIISKFKGKEPPKTGRPQNWMAQFVAMQAADIYRTVFSGKIERTVFSGKTESSPPRSFRAFLEDFCKDIPDAERADSRALARWVWGGGYEGTPFAPVR